MRSQRVGGRLEQFCCPNSIHGWHPPGLPIGHPETPASSAHATRCFREHLEASLMDEQHDAQLASAGCRLTVLPTVDSIHISGDDWNRPMSGSRSCSCELAAMLILGHLLQQSSTTPLRSQAIHKGSGRDSVDTCGGGNPSPETRTGVPDDHPRLRNSKPERQCCSWRVPPL
jgi:hypothetical protein